MILNIKKINNIGYYKYESKNETINQFLDYYPINKTILEYLKKEKFIKYEFENNKPKTINGKLIVLI